MYNSLTDKTLLYVEDDTSVLHNIAKVLEQRFKAVHTAPNAEMGYRIFQNNSIDIVLVDIELPGMSGIELVQKIRLIDKALPVVVISAYTKTDYLLDSVNLKIERYIVKPFTTKKITELLEHFNAMFATDSVIEIMKGVSMDVQELRLSFADETHTLTQKEKRFLDSLHVKGFVNYDEIDAIWDDATPSENAIRSFIKTLRKKLPKGVLKNRQGIGYYVE